MADQGDFKLLAEEAGLEAIVVTGYLDGNLSHAWNKVKIDDELTKKGEVTLRTDYELNDETFYEITDAVYAIMDDDTDLYGYYWLGVIYLTTER